MNETMAHDRHMASGGQHTHEYNGKRRGRMQHADVGGRLPFVGVAVKSREVRGNNTGNGHKNAVVSTEGSHHHSS